jgi:hypothetical protein
MGIEDLGNISVAGPSHSIPMFSFPLVYMQVPFAQNTSIL